MTQYRICKICGQEFSYPDKDEIRINPDGVRLRRYPICKPCWNDDIKDEVVRKMITNAIAESMSKLSRIS